MSQEEWNAFPSTSLQRGDLPQRLQEAAPHKRVDIVGDVDALRLPSIAIVGTRGLSVRHTEWVRRVIEDVVTNVGRAVVSGGANGVDALAHEASLNAGLPTVVVLASGIEKAGPKPNLPLFKKAVRAGGAVVGFGPPKRTPYRACFLKRNAFIAACARAVVVAAAPVRSGALSTAAAAKRMGIPVLAVPGPALDAQFEGCHELLRRGAHICTGAADVQAVLGEAAQVRLPLGDAPRQAVPDHARRLFALIDEGLSVDQAAREIGIDAADAQMALLELRLAGFRGV